jgi:curved DNA-binding protein
MEYKDYYKILGVEKNSSEKDIKAAYRKLARQYHPDVNDAPDAEERFKEINEAYQVLGEAESRTKYDQLGSDWRRWQQSGGEADNFDWSQWESAPNGQRVHVRYGGSGDFGDIFGGGVGVEEDAFSDFFRSIFGGMGGRTTGRGQGGFGGFAYADQPQPGRDLETEVEISLPEAYHGATRLLDKDGHRLEVKIPAGAKTGSRVRFRGEGGSGVSGGQAGDLYLKVRVLPDDRFERREDNLYVTVPVDLYTAVLGGEIKVPTMTGEVKLKIPAGTQNGQSFRLRGKGTPKRGKADQYGDLYARVDLRVPTNLSEEQQALFRQLRDLEIGS